MVDNNVNINNIDHSQYEIALSELLQNIKNLASTLNGDIPPTSTNVIPEEDDSLPGLTKPTAKLSLETLVQAIGFAARKAAITKNADVIKAKGEEAKAVNDKQLEEMAKKLEELAKKRNLNPFLKAFKWIGAIFGAIASAVTIAVGAITANPVMIAAGVLGMIASIDNIISLATDGKASIAVGLTKLGQLMGMSEEAAQIFSMSMTIALAVATITVGIVSGVGGLSAVENASKAINTLRTISSIATFVNAGVTAGEAGLEIGAAVIDYKIAKTEISQKEFEAMLEQLREAQKFLKEFIEAEMKRNAELMGKVKDIIDSNNEAQAAILATPTNNMA